MSPGCCRLLIVLTWDTDTSPQASTTAEASESHPWGLRHTVCDPDKQADTPQQTSERCLMSGLPWSAEMRVAFPLG